MSSCRWSQSCLHTEDFYSDTVYRQDWTIATVYFTNLPKNIDEIGLKKAVQQYCPHVVSVYIEKSPINQSLSGYGYVRLRFYAGDEVIKAIVEGLKDWRARLNAP